MHLHSSGEKRFFKDPVATEGPVPWGLHWPACVDSSAFPRHLPLRAHLCGALALAGPVGLSCVGLRWQVQHEQEASPGLGSPGLWSSAAQAAFCSLEKGFLSLPQQVLRVSTDLRHREHLSFQGPLQGGGQHLLALAAVVACSGLDLP